MDSALAAASNGMTGPTGGIKADRDDCMGTGGHRGELAEEFGKRGGVRTDVAEVKCT